ncbi:MAG: hypothetical protein ABFS41_10225, partial [Myxococcota bacterium]
MLVFAASRGAQLSYEVGGSSNSRGLYLVDDSGGSKNLQAQGALRGGANTGEGIDDRLERRVAP